VPVSPARACAYRVLRRVASEGAFADRAFRAEADRAGLDPRDRAFAQRLAYGALQRRRTLDFAIDALSSRPPDPAVRDALRLGVLQLVWLDSVPDRAAVDQTVELVKSAEPRAAGFANAVMRRAAREAEALIEALPADSAVALSHPDWLVEMWRAALGAEDAAALMRRDNEPAESALRANELRTTRDELVEALGERGAEARPVPDLPEGVVIDGPFDAHGSDLFDLGLLMPQSRGSMLVARVVDPQPDERVLDMCAAPGAKATQLAALMRGSGEVVAVEENAARARELQANADRLGAATVAVRHGDARSPVEPDGFDRVLLDAPCSDLGTLQSRPDARWRKGPEQVRELAALQRELLEAGAAQVRPGGALVYSVCTISPQEGPQQVERLLADHPELGLDGDPIQLLPHRDGTDGFFISRMRRVAG
jgi:16S rRNA (cytosine967-C5)-methyltransferase